MENNPNNIPAGGESLNERLRRAAEMARRNMADKPQQTPAERNERNESFKRSESFNRNERDESFKRAESFNRPQESRLSAGGISSAAHQESRLSAGGTQTASQQTAHQESRLSAGGTTPAAPKAHATSGAPATPPATKPSNSSKTWLFVAIIAAVVILAAVAIFFIQRKSDQTAAEQQQQIEQLQLQNEQIQLANEYGELNNEFAQYENQSSLLANDSIVQKYAAARAQVEKLLNELKNEKNKSAAQIAQLKGEIETLKSILRTYVEQINELKKENQSLRDENDAVKAENSQLSQTVQSVEAKNQHLNERMTLAEKLNVTGVNLVALNKKGKTEKNVTKARQLMVTFTIPQNNSTPVGEKTIYCRIISPEGELLAGNGGSFSFEGSRVQATAKKSIEYQGEEIGGIKIYWDVSATLNPGDYTVELFADNYRLVSRRFTLSK